MPAKIGSYNPKSKPQGGVSAGDRADFGQGPPGRMTKQDQIGRRVEDYGMSPWYGKDGNPMPWSGPPGQERGQRAPMFTPNAGDPRNAGYFQSRGPEWEANWEAQNAASNARRNELLGGNDAYQQAKAAGDLKGQIAAMMAMKQGMQQQRFVDQGGTAETWQNRYRNENDWPRPGVAPSPGGGRTMPPPSPAPAPGGGRTMPQAVPPMQNPMMEGYNPGASKSGMGQSPMSGPAMSTGNPMGGMEMGGMDPLAAYFSRMQGGYSPMVGGAGMGGMGFGRFGGFNPYQMLGGGGMMGYNPAAQFSPYMMGGMY